MSEEMIKKVQENAKTNERKRDLKKIGIGALIGTAITGAILVGVNMLRGSNDDEDEDYVEVSDSNDETTEKSTEETDD